MELSWLLVLKVAAFLIITLLVIGLFARLAWLTKLKFSAALLAGIILIGILAWPLAAPSEPFGVVSIVAGSISLGDAAALAALALLVGFISYFLSWPHGRDIGVLAVPAGLAVWALRSGSVADLMQQRAPLVNTQAQAAAAGRQALFAALRWEPLFWLAVVAAGLVGGLLARKIRSKKTESSQTREKADPKPNLYLNAAIATVGSVLIALICIRIFARDVRTLDRELGAVLIAQPAVGQIAFAVCFSFGLAAFVVKKFLGAGYIWPTIASSLLTALATTIYVKQDALQYLVRRWPAVFFSSAALSILPLQMVAFGALGSIAGYWLAVRYDYWRKHG